MRTFLTVFLLLATILSVLGQPASFVFQQIQVNERATAPAAGVNRVMLYAKDVAGVTHVFARYSNGTEVDLGDTGTGNFGEASLAGLVNNQSLWSGASASRTLTFSLSGANDPVLTALDGIIGLSSGLNVTGPLNVGGAAVFTNTSFTIGGVPLILSQIQPGSISLSNVSASGLSTFIGFTNANTDHFLVGGGTISLKNGVIQTNPVVMSHSGSAASLTFKDGATVLMLVDANTSGVTDFTIPASGGDNARVFPGGKWQFEKGLTNMNATWFGEIAAPGTPGANQVVLYGKDDAGVTKLFYKGENGTEIGPLAAAGAGSGDVTAAANFDTDNAVIRADGTGKGVQKSGVSINDTNGLSVPGGGAFHELVSSNGVTAANFTGTGSGAAGMRLFDTAGTEYIGLLSPSDVTASYQLRPPAAIATAGFLLAGAVSSSISDVSVVVATSDGLVGAITGEEGTAGGLTRATGATHDQTKVGFSGALGTDDTYNGDQITGTQAGETVAQWELVRMHSDGQFHLADADAAGEFPARGLAVAATSDNTAITVLTQGTVRNDAWNWTVGGTLYLSTTAGGLTQTAPSTSGNAVQVVGFAISADIAYFNFTGHYLEVQ